MPGASSGPGAAGASPVDDAQVGRIFREASGRSVATLIRILGDIDLAEDAVQEAFALALRRWPGDGLPLNPGGWITTTARHLAIDKLRRESRGRELIRDVAVLRRGEDHRHLEEVGSVQDDRLRLIFICCHPALSTEAQVALTLRLLGGLSTAEVARAFLVAEPTMAQRLVRAKRKITAARIPYRVPSAADLPRRLRPVLAVLYLIYNAGAEKPAAAEGDVLCGEAIRLTRLVASSIADEPEVAGLLALLLLTESRRRTRIAVDGGLVLLRDQDRARWDRSMISEGQEIVRACLRRDQPGPYQLQAAINAVHTDADSTEATDWSQIVALYDQLLTFTPTPVVVLNRAIAVGELAGPGPALALIDGLDLANYHLFHATRADLLRRLQRRDEAINAYETAALLAPTEIERNFLTRQARLLAHS